MKLTEVLEAERRALEQREEELKAKIRELQNEMMCVREKLAYSSSLKVLPIEGFVPLKGVPRTEKYAQVHRAWLGVQYAFRDDFMNLGLRSKDLEIVMRSFISDLKNTTFRAYLHRFKKAGLIDKNSSGRWFITNRAEGP